MKYCAIDEAFDNSIKKQMLKYDEQNIMMNNHNISNNKYKMDQSIKETNIPPNTFDNYTDIELPSKNYYNYYNSNENSNKNNNANNINNTNNINNSNTSPQFFTAQGDINTGNYFGTSISELKKKNSYDDEFSSFGESNFSDDTFSMPLREKQMDHEECILKFMNGLSNNTENMSQCSENDKIYDHIKTCKYCRSKINQKMKKTEKYINQNNENNENKGEKESKEKVKVKEYFDSNISNKSNNIVNEYFSVDSIGYDLKELLVILLSGIILVFILDLLVKIGKKSKYI